MRTIPLMGLLAGLALATGGSCRPDPDDAFAADVRVICEYVNGPCNGSSPDPAAVDACVESKADDLMAKVREQGDDCVRQYAQLYACAAGWTCAEFHTFLREHEGPCLEIEEVFDQDCGGLSPFSD